jgi:hypothetical protein
VTGDNGTEIGLLYQKDWDTSDFPLTEIKRALKRFGRRADLAGLTPAVVMLNPTHEVLVQPEMLADLGLTLQLNEKIGVGYIWLTGRPGTIADEPAHLTLSAGRPTLV